MNFEPTFSLRSREVKVMKPKPWKTLSSRPVYENPWMRLREDVAEMPDKRTTIYGVVTFGDCVGVVPFVDKNNVILVRQEWLTGMACLGMKTQTAVVTKFTFVTKNTLRSSKLKMFTILTKMATSLNGITALILTLLTQNTMEISVLDILEQPLSVLQDLQKHRSKNDLVGALRGLYS